MKKELTQREKAFADYYIETGNAEKSAIRAGYSERYARGNAHKLVARGCIAEYIAQRMKKTEEKRIASADEVMEFLTAVMKGEVKDAFGLDASLADRTAAARELMKRHNVVGDNNKDALEKLDSVLDQIGGVV